MKLLAEDFVTVTQTSQTLAQLGVTVNSGIQRLGLFPSGVVYRAFNKAAVIAQSGQVPLDGFSEPTDATTAGLLQFVAFNVKMAVRQYG